MTKATRRSLRSTTSSDMTSRINSTPSPISKPTVKRMATKKVATPSAQSISDFKQVNGKTLYYVHRNDPEHSTGTWEYEETIESLDVLDAFHERVHSSTGYYAKGNNDFNTATPSATNEENTATSNMDQQTNHVDATNSKRLGRTSKTRAMLRLMEAATLETTTTSTTMVLDSDDSDQDLEPKVTKKRKRSGAAQTRTKRSTATTTTPRGKALIRLQLELIEQRKNERAIWLESHPWQDHDHSSSSTSKDVISCCLRCSTKAYRQAVIGDDMGRLKELLQDTKVYPSWKTEDRSVTEDSVLKLATSLGNEKAIEMLSEDNESARIKLSTSLTTYGSNTGFVSRYTFGRAVKKVNESRGNRQGNSAFYRSAYYEDFNVDRSYHKAGMDEYLSLLHSSVAGEPKVIKCLSEMKDSGEYTYHVVASGNHVIAANILQDKQDSAGFNLLHYAALVDQELPTHRKNQILKKCYYSRNLSPVMCASINPSADHLKTLFQQLEPAERVEMDEFSRTVAHFAAVSSTPDCLEYLISENYNFSQGDKFRLTPLVQAARHGRADNIRPLLKYLSHDNLPTDFANQTLLRNRRRPLHYAANFGHSEACKVLVDCGATVDALDSTLKATPLMFAALRGHLDCVKTLIEYGHAGIHLVDKYARSPLHLACMDGHYQVVKYLLMQGLETNAHDSSSNTPAHYAAAFGHLDVVKLLVEFGGADPSSNNVWRATPCSVANLKGHIAIVKYLLSLPDGNVNVDFKDEDGYTMLHHAVAEKVTNTNEIDQNLRRIQLLLDKNANVNTTTIHGDTVLHVLMKANHYINHLQERMNKGNTVVDDEICIDYQRKVYSLLLNAGADVNAINNATNTPLAVAMVNKNYHLVALLIKDHAKYWCDIDSAGNTFFHGLFYGAAYLDNIRMDKRNQLNSWTKYDTIHPRFVNAIDGIWSAIQTNPIPADQINETKIDHVNNLGYPPLLYGIFEAIKMQKEFVANEKSIVKDESAPHYHNRPSRYGVTNLSSTTQPSTDRRPMRFVFKFDSFFENAKKILDQFKPDMNAVVELPKDYLKENPKAKPENYPKETGCGALQLAAHTQHAPLLELLLTHGTNPNQQSKNIKNMCGIPALVSAYFTRKDNNSLYLSGDMTIAKERIRKVFDIVMPDFERDLYDSLDLLLQYGADPCLVDGNGVCALMKVARALDGKAAKMMCDSPSILSQRGSGQGLLEQRDQSGSTALMMAFSAYQIKHNLSDDKDKDKIDMAAITHLVFAGADPNATCKNGNTVFMNVFRLGYYPLVDTVMQWAQWPLNHMAQNKDQETPLIVACKSKNPMAVELYLKRMEKDHNNGDLMDINNCVNALDADQNGPLALVASNGDLNAVRILLEHQANPNNQASKKNPLFEAIKSKHYGVTEALLCAGANVNAQDQATGYSALHYAIKSEKIALVRVLLKHGAPPNYTDLMQQTPLHWAIQLSKNQTNRSMRVERLLLQGGADINANDIFDRTPLHIVFTGLHTIPLMQTTDLTYKKVKLLKKERKEAQKEEEDIKQYVSRYGRIRGDLDKWLEQYKRSALEQEKARKDLEENNNGDSDDKDKVILTDDDRVSLAKYLGFQFEKDITISSSDPVDMLKDLMDTPGMKLDAFDSFGRTPFHYAVIVDSISCVNMMLDSLEMDVNSQDNDKNGGVQLALRYGHSNMAVMVHNRGGIASDITFPDGNQQSAISYSLAHSYMNVSYHFMSNTETVLQSLSDALIKGKFHFAHTLLRKAQGSVLGGTIPSTNQNLWHVISNFQPFDVEMWNDYLPDFLEKVGELNLNLQLDKYNYTPLHYASLHGQETLLRHLLTLDPRPQLSFDSVYGRSQVWAAVNSNNINCVKLLLDAGLPLTEGNKEMKSSILQVAVAHDNLDMVKVLLEHDVDLDSDSDYGRRNCVMYACVKQQNQILQALVDAGADVNKPSTITRRHKGKVHSVVTYPLFVASIHASNETLAILLKASANPNIIGPKDKTVESGRSCLMFNICKEKAENVKLLLAHGASLDIKDASSDRSAFYRIFFEKKSLPCSNEIYEMMFTHTPGPQINVVDVETGMTPLELAIRKHDIPLVDRLLVLGANPNITSCKKKLEPSDLYNDVVNAVFHCVLNNDFDIFKVICETSQHDIDWAAVDSERRTILSRLVDVDEGYGYENTEILYYLANHIGKDQFKAIAEMKDYQGNRPMDIALLRNRNDQYNKLVQYGAQRTTLDDETMDNTNHAEESMDTEEIPLETIEEDAESERVLLQALVEEKKKLEPKKPTTEENKVEIDSYSKLGRVGTIVFDQGEPYDIMILKVEVASWLHSSNMFYKMSVIYNRILDLYVLWTRWGAFGEEGMHQKTPYLTQEEAVAEFKSIFKSKTGNTWEQRTDFVEKPGRYQLIKARDPAKDAILENVDVNFIHNEIQPTKLPNNLHNTMKLFCNFSTLKNAYKNISLDIPIGQIPPESIREATAIIDHLETIATQISDPAFASKKKALIHEAIQESSKYYRLLPINNPNNRSGLQPLLTVDKLNEERSRLDDARYINYTISVVLAAKHRAKEINPFDYSYRSLGCQLAEVVPGCREFNVVSKYISSTSKDSGYEIAHLFSVNRPKETERFKPFASEKNRKLLWHGSQLGNFMGILNQGLRCKPAAAHDNGSLYGNGIYFADMFCKSVDFATNIYGTKNPAYGLLLLCEVALGKECNLTPYSRYTYDNEKQEKGYTSIKGLGKEGPNLSNALYDANGVMIPMGPAVKLDAPEAMERFPRTTYNEYIVQDEARVKIRYMVLVRHNDYCFLCQNRTNRKNLKNLEDYEFKEVTWKGVNSFEQQAFDMYLHSINKTPKQYFDEKLPSLLKNQNTNESLQNWCLPLDIERTSTVCNGCANKVATIMITKDLQDLQKSNPTDGKYPFFDLKLCRDGRGCKLQHESIQHAKEYQHWICKKTNDNSDGIDLNNRSTECMDLDDESDDYKDNNDDDDDDENDSEDDDEPMT